MSQPHPPRSDHAPLPPAKKKNNSEKKRSSASWNPSSFPYPVDYNDHFETPLQAYRDIQPMIDWLVQPHAKKDDTNGAGSIKSTRGGTRRSPILYDPYYCNGRTKILLESIGYPNVVHEQRDFYHDIRTNQVPIHDVFVTNPPYSDDHKLRCLEFCCSRLVGLGSNNVPFFVLVPTYVASKAYYRSCLQKHGLLVGSTSDNNEGVEGVVYLVPNRHRNGTNINDNGYRYEHPESTGHDISPFESLWICGIGRDRARIVREWWDHHQEEEIDSGASNVNLYCSLDELEKAGVITTERRPNPRQRRKRKSVGTAGPPTNATMPSKPGHESSAANKAQGGGNKRSKYRDESGKRSKRRF